MWVCVACVLCVVCVALYACGVRRIYGLLRVCLPFCLLCSCFSSSLPFVSLVCPLVVLFLLSCLSCLFVLFLWVFGCVVGFSFSLADYTQKERAQRFCLASSLVLLWVALFGCCFVLLELGRTQAVNIVTKFYIKIFAAGAAYCFALACVPTCVVVSLSFFSFHIFFL